MQDRLHTAIQMREAGQAQEARTLLLELLALYPNDAELNYQTAWVHDNLGLERESVPFYLCAINLGLSKDSLQGALLGLGSTYRALGEYTKAEQMLRRGMQEFPQDRAFPIFLAMALHNLQRHAEAMQLLLTNLAETTAEPSILRYKKALLFYAPQLDKTWANDEKE
ncbi:tetratricopeptide repeat protein [Dictyobacter halimunensis]